MTDPLTHDRYKSAMIPALLTGMITNLYISGIFIYIGEFIAIIPSIAGLFVFLICFWLLKADKINAKNSFLLGGYVVAIEVSIHTYLIGWDSGCFYFLFLLPTVFLLNTNWKIWITIVFNGSIITLFVLLWYIFQDSDPLYPIDSNTEIFISLINLTGTGLIIIVIMIYFSRTINKKDEALVIVNEALEKQNKEIFSQHQYQQILLKEIHHRVKNNLQIISSLLSLQSNAIDNKDVSQVLDESRRRIEAIALIHEKLYQGDKIDRVDFKSYLMEIMRSQQKINSNLKCEVTSSEVAFKLDIAVPLGLIISEMIVNSVKHAFKGIENPELKVELNNNNQTIELIVQDNGIGLPENFSLEQPVSLGTEIIQALTDQIEAEIKYENDNGAKFTIVFQE
jgi:two-component sensor histidine kinase